MSDPHEIFHKFRRCMLVAFPGLEIVLANQNAPEEPHNFATILIREVGTSGWGEITYADNSAGNLNETYKNRHEYNASINFYKKKGDGTHPMQQARRLVAFCKSGLGARQFSDEEIGFYSSSIPRDLTDFEQGQFEARGQVDILFSFMESDEFQIEGIDSVPLGATLEEGAESYAISLTLNTNNTN